MICHFLGEGVTFVSDSPGRGKWSKCGIFYFLELCCDHTLFFFQRFSTVLKRFWPGHSKHVFDLVLAHLEPKKELFEGRPLENLGPSRPTPWPPGKLNRNQRSTRWPIEATLVLFKTQMIVLFSLKDQSWCEMKKIDSNKNKSARDVTKGQWSQHVRTHHHW